MYFHFYWRIGVPIICRTILVDVLKNVPLKRTLISFHESKMVNFFSHFATFQHYWHELKFHFFFDEYRHRNCICVINSMPFFVVLRAENSIELFLNLRLNCMKNVVCRANGENAGQNQDQHTAHLQSIISPSELKLHFILCCCCWLFAI